MRDSSPFTRQTPCRNDVRAALSARFPGRKDCVVSRKGCARARERAGTGQTTLFRLLEGLPGTDLEWNTRSRVMLSAQQEVPHDY